MRLSVGLPTYAGDEERIPPDRLFAYARDAEAYGFSGLWTIEHLLEPATYRTSWYDPLAALSAIAGATDRIPIGTSILNLSLRNPVLLAKRAATIQRLSGGRLSLGLGTGYLESEFEAANVPFASRSDRYLESIDLLRRLLTTDEVTFDGEFHSVSDLRLEPNLGSPPSLLAAGEGVGSGDDRHVRDSVTARLDAADGWFAPPRAISNLRSDWADFADHLEDAGRRPSDVRRVGFQYLHLVPGVDREMAIEKQNRAYRNYLGGADADLAEKQDFADNWLMGSLEEVTDHIDAYADAGFDELMLHPVGFEPSDLDRQLRLWRDHVLPRYA
jgi:probable F420-dependent oxidoreductase